MRTAYVVAAVSVVVGIVIGLAQSEFGEIKAFYAAMQGLCFGVVPFLWGYPSGRRAALKRV